MNRDRENYPNHYMVASELLLGHSAHVSIKGKKAKYFATPILDMIGDSTMTFDLEATPVLLLKYHDHFYVDRETLLDFSRISTYTRIEAYAHKYETVFGDVRIG